MSVADNEFLLDKFFGVFGEFLDELFDVQSHRQEETPEYYFWLGEQANNL